MADQPIRYVPRSLRRAKPVNVTSVRFAVGRPDAAGDGYTMLAGPFFTLNETLDVPGQDAESLVLRLTGEPPDVPLYRWDGGGWVRLD